MTVDNKAYMDFSRAEMLMLRASLVLLKEKSQKVLTDHLAYDDQKNFAMKQISIINATLRKINKMLKRNAPENETFTIIYD